MAKKKATQKTKSTKQSAAATKAKAPKSASKGPTQKPSPRKVAAAPPPRTSAGRRAAKGANREAAETRPPDSAQIRARVREMTSSALRGGAPSPERVGQLFRDAMRGTFEAVDRAMPPALRSAKLREAVDTYAGHFERLAHEASRAGQEAIAPVVSAAKEAGRRPVEAVQETVRTGVHAASGAASSMLSATGGVLSGIADGIADAAAAKGPARRSR